MNETAPLRARAEIDLAALRANVRTLRAHAPSAALMAVVKSDAYGHGAVPCARAAREAGATWLGTATPEEALALRAAGLPGRILCWLWTPGGPWAQAIEADLDVSVSGLWALREVTQAARDTGAPARVQLKADTGLGRNGCGPADWPELVAQALRAEADGLITVTGLWSHFACADEPGHPSIQAQLTLFREMVAYAEERGARPEVRHIANSPATLTLPESHFDLVRTGIAVYGVSPSPEIGTPADFGLRPVMTLSASLALVKHVEGGTASATDITTSPPATRPSASCPSGTRTASRATPPAPDPCWSAASCGRSPAGSRWTSSSSTSAGTSRKSVRRLCCSGPGTGASRPPRTGRGLREQLRTKSSPGSEPAYRVCT